VRCYDSGVKSAGAVPWPDIQTVFLDRDGVLNEKAPEGEYIWRWQDFRVLDGVPEAIAELNRAGIRVIVVTNQRGIALGRYTPADVALLHAEFQAQLAQQNAHIDAFYVCPHSHGECNCRKPLPGLFEQAVADFLEIQAQTSVMIGDSAVDMEFGRRLGMKTILIGDADSPLRSNLLQAGLPVDLLCSSLREAAKSILYR
jgi:D-glycero-D-manno-heptose 1,7-bisphosphate phosphatase